MLEEKFERRAEIFTKEMLKRTESKPSAASEAIVAKLREEYEQKLTGTREIYEMEVSELRTKLRNFGDITHECDMLRTACARLEAQLQNDKKEHELVCFLPSARRMQQYRG